MYSERGRYVINIISYFTSKSGIWLVISRVASYFHEPTLFGPRQLTSEITEPYSTTSVISGLFYTHAKYDKKITRSRRGIWADTPRYAYREILL